MSFYRSLLWWLLLATLGALAWELLAPDLGEVIIRWHGTTVTTTMAFALAVWALLTLVLWGAWYLLRLPYNAWRSLAQRQARNRLINGLTALHEGRYARAETLLAKAAQETDARSVALLAAREAAIGHDDLVAAAGFQTALAGHDPLAAALGNAARLMAHGKAAETLASLQPFSGKNGLPPVGLRLRSQALAANGRAQDALDGLVAMTKEQGLSASEFAVLELSLRAQALGQSGDADTLWRRWTALSPSARCEVSLLQALAQRGAELGLEQRTGDALVEAIDRHWDESLVAALAQLPGQTPRRLETMETWLETHSTSPALLLALGRSYCDGRQPQRSISILHRAIAQGVGSPAWEQLGRAFDAQNDTASARNAYANALRALRGEPVQLLETLGLREQIAAAAVAEHRNEHGMPLLPK